MSFARLLTQTVSILPFEQDGVDEYNDPDPTFGDPVEAKAYLEKLERQDSEETRDRETAVSRWRLYLLPTTAIGHRDRVLYDGLTFEVHGSVNEVWNPRTRRTHHIEADLNLLENVFDEVGS